MEQNALINQVVKAVMEMDPEDREEAVKVLKMYATGRIQFRKDAGERMVCYNMETGQITICLTAPDDTAGIIAGFMEVEKRHWLDDMAS